MRHRLGGKEVVEGRLRVALRAGSAVMALTALMALVLSSGWVQLRWC